MLLGTCGTLAELVRKLEMITMNKILTNVTSWSFVAQTNLTSARIGCCAQTIVLTWWYTRGCKQINNATSSLLS